MRKINFHIYISTDIVDMLRLKQRQDDDFIPSQIIENFLREFLQEEFSSKSLEKEKLAQREREISEELALIKMQKEAMLKAKEDKELEWYRKRGIKKGVEINLEDLQ